MQSADKRLEPSQERGCRADTEPQEEQKHESPVQNNPLSPGQTEGQRGQGKFRGEGKAGLLC